MSTPESKIVVSIETLLRGMPKASRDLATLEKRLRALSNIKVASQPIQSTQLNKAAIAAQRLQQQQQRLAVSAQELANRQERARQSADRLAQAQNRLTRAQERQRKASSTTGRQTEQGARAAEALQRQRSAGIIKQLREQERTAERTGKAFRDRFITLGGIFERLGQGISSFGSRLTVALTAPLAALGAIAVRSAVGIDAQVNTLKAFAGSAEAAEARLAELIATAQRTPGLTTSLGLMLDAQLRLANVTVETIDKVVPAIGRLNAVQQLQDPARFSQNLVQLVTQNFERIDLKELVGQSPVAGQIIKEIFNVDSPINAEAIRESAQRLGLTTTDAFFTAFAEAAARNSALANVTESIATRFAKLVDRVTIAFRPLGIAIIESFTPIVNFLVPIIETLGRGFASLPEPIQTLVVAFGALAAAAGPTVFILGNVISTVGSLIGAYAQLVALGLTPTIKGFQLLSQVMRGNAALTAGQAATTAAAAGGWIALAGAIGVAIAVIAIVGVAIAGYSKSQKEAVKIGDEQIAATNAQIVSLKSQIKFIDDLKDGVERTAREQKRLAEIYSTLNTQAKIRVTAITDEEKRLAGLREELSQLLKLRQAEQIQQAANLAASLANTSEQIQASERERDVIAARVQGNILLSQSIAATGKITAEQSQQLARQGITASQAEDAIGALNAENEQLIQTQDELIKTGNSLNGTAEEQGQALGVLAKQTGLSARELLSAAKAMGLFKGEIDTALPAIERFIIAQGNAAKNTDIFTEALRKQNEELLRAGKNADDASKQRNDIIKAAASLAREASDSFEGALKFLNAFIAANPDLRAAIEKERQLAGKSFQEFIEDALGGRPDTKGQSALRNAQQQLADALSDVTEAEAEKRATIERTANERLLQGNEALYRLQLISYREYLETRAQLTNENLDLEITAAALIAKNARTAQIRLTDEAKKAGIPGGERTKRLAQAAKAQEAAIRAETRLAELESERAQIADDLKIALREAAIQQLKDVRQLEIEYGQLTGRIQDALNAATDERFREALEGLGKTQDRLNKQLQAASKARKADLVAELTEALNLNQRQIEAINNIVRQERAANELAAAQEFVRQAQERQAELERQIGFEVEFRGLKEEEAIRRRLEGERKLADSLSVVRDVIQDQIDALNAQGIKPPQALIEFITETKAAIQGLGELSFSEQFRIAEQEFNRINDQRIRKIEDVERAVRNRTIAEVEGQIIIRQINREYTADLEAQLEVLKRIAKASGQDDLRRRAEDTGETVKDTKDEIADLGKQIESAGKDAVRSGFTDFFNDLLNRTATAKEALLSLLNSVVTRINDVIAENLSKALFESIFGGAEGASGGILQKIRGIFGGDEGAEGGLGGIAAGAAQGAEATAAATALTTAGTVAGTALTTGATAASTALATGGATASASLVGGITAAAASFAASVTAAGAAFAATVAAASSAQAVGGLGGALGAARGDFLTPKPGGRLLIAAEAGYPEAVLTTDPKHAARQYGILKAFLRQTRGLQGRIPRFADGGFVSPRQTEMDLLSSIERGPSPLSVMPVAALANAGGGSTEVRLRQILVTEDMVGEYLNSPEGERVFVDKLSRNAPLLRRLTQRR